MGKTGFFVFQCFFDLRLTLFQLGISIAHFFDQIGHQFVEEGVFLAEFVAVAHGAADDAAQHIAAAFVAWHHAVGNQEGTGTDVVGNHFQAGNVHAECHAGFAGGGFEQVFKQIDFIVAVHMLHHGGHALQTHAGIHRGFGQRVHIARFVAVELHEYVVPDFDKAVAVFFGASRRATPDMLAVVVEDFGAGAAGAGVAHLPEVVGGVALAFVVADADDFFGGQADFVEPDVVGFIVFGINGGQQFFFGQVQPFGAGEEFPGEFDGVVFEIVAEREVAHHFKESVVAGGIADVFKVVVFAAGTHTFLCGGGAVVGAFVEAEEHVFKLVHAGVGEQQRRVVVRHQRRRADDLVSFGFKEL